MPPVSTIWLSSCLASVNARTQGNSPSCFAGKPDAYASSDGLDVQLDFRKAWRRCRSRALASFSALITATLAITASAAAAAAATAA
eukprot:CAMPEP_0119333724 /NCGR_PEP_ID=MMETSP1333-20130426/85825_1 /TAXON_ID=418940 /ORGANISM="Scyphosphaera apsteinii, Strain RCC1455" /LENGTH=85 /DNA_ID=CAMNT_0007343859 /DNA_START=259 /DNA_END=512 /DNA_ORIENTATION=-